LKKAVIFLFLSLLQRRLIDQFPTLAMPKKSAYSKEKLLFLLNIVKKMV